jgi:phage terminase large subunit GpA-like protein
LTAHWSSAFFSTLAPRPRVSVSEWADTYRVIAQGTSPEPGRWRTDRAPYLREPMDAISDPAVERVVFCAASQVAKTELILNAIGYFASADPSPMLLVQPSEGAMVAFAKERVETTFRSSPILAGLFSESRRDPDNTLLMKMFPGGYLAMAWASSASSLASRPIRVLLGDEIDRWPNTTGRDGDPWFQAVQRTSNFHNRKIVAVSTPTIEDTSPILALYEKTDQRHFHVPCPRCGVFQVLEWSGVIYKADDGTINLDDVYYRCAHCNGRIEERDRPAMLSQGQWVAEIPERRHRGYQISALYSPWVRWAELASEWVTATQSRDKQGLQAFINLRLGEGWNESGFEVNADQLEKNREHYEAEVPDAVRLLTIGADVQADRIEAEVVGWGRGKESWGIHYAVLVGDTTQTDVWQRFDELQTKIWRKADGTALVAHRVLIDSGFRADEVYTFTKPRLFRVAACKGRGGDGVPLVNDKPTIQGQQRALVYHVGANAGNEAVYSRLALSSPGPGYCHFPVDQDRHYDTLYFKGLCSEKPRLRQRGLRRVREWVQVVTRNEPLDCRRYATAAMELSLLLDGFDLDVAPQSVVQQQAMAAPMPQRRRRVLSRGVG